MKTHSNDFLYAGYSFRQEWDWKAKREELREQEKAHGIGAEPDL